ncbi:MAG: ribbon-helix-helix protein, CopG family [Holophagales bacterium]|nr:ribbon-helix-helix protein, CopG family [Holophagales bacterium]
MSTRLQVLLDESELKEIRRAARRRGMTVSEWVRGALRDGRLVEPGTAARPRGGAAPPPPPPPPPRAEMLEEIESGYRSPV